jgi:hypothetical protein
MVAGRAETATRRRNRSLSIDSDCIHAVTAVVSNIVQLSSSMALPTSLQPPPPPLQPSTLSSLSSPPQPLPPHLIAAILLLSTPPAPPLFPFRGLQQPPPPPSAECLYELSKITMHHVACIGLALQLDERDVRAFTPSNQTVYPY